MVSSKMSVVKYVFGIFNLLFLLLACGIFYFGFARITGSMDFTFDIINRYAPGRQFAYCLFTFGAIVFVMSFLGCYGSFRESKVSLISFGLILGIIVLAQLAVCILWIAFPKEVDERITTTYLPKLIENYNFSDPTDRLTMIVDDMQSRLHCCGVNGTQDWNNKIPFSCCTAYKPIPVEERSSSVTPSPYDSNLAQPSPAPGVVRYCPNDAQQPAYTEGCKPKVIHAVSTNIWYLAAAGIAFTLIELMSIIMSCTVAISIKKNYEII